MKEILIFAGTTEGRRLSECLCASGIAHTVCVATEYGELVLKEHPLARVHQGRMNSEEIADFLKENEFAAVVDATHPYAEQVTENIKRAMEGSRIPYLRLKREDTGNHDTSTANIRYFTSNEACAAALEEVEGNILLTTGSKELASFCVSERVKSRLYVRVLPGMESLALCMEQGILGKQILALQGPFSTEMNAAIIRQYRIQCLVTKASGRLGGYEEKLAAAKQTGASVFVICRKQAEESGSFDFKEICCQLEVICGQPILWQGKWEILLAGVGMGSEGCMTQEVYRAMESADILLGAERLIAPFQTGLGIIKKPYYRAEQIIPYLQKLQREDSTLENRRVVILFSGDSGFYSGCKNLYQALQKEIAAGGLAADVRILPGISSVSYLASCVGENYQDAAIYSMHGKQLKNLAGKIKRAEKTFLLMSGVKDVNRLGALLTEAGLTDCEIIVGFSLSYPKQQIKVLTPEECSQVTEEGLYVCLVKNPHPEASGLTHGRADAAFIRDKVPMTKEEVREVSICKLKLQKGGLVYDIGSGTGSIAVELAGLSDDIQVYAIEHKEEAAALIEKNRERFGLQNIEVIRGEAPECFAGLPAPTHAFIGGSGGRLKEILGALYRLNPKMRVVVNAVSMETICEIREALFGYLAEFPVEEEEMIQLQVSRVRKAGQYHLMQAENPVWICAFTFCGEKQK